MKTIFHITGMHCESCATLLTDVLQDVPGVTHVKVENKSGLATVEHDPNKTTLQALRVAVEAEGYGVRS